MNPIPTLIAVALSLPTLAIAQTERDLESHAHGSATLNVAIDGSAVFLELKTPWDNLVGFEHAPSTDEQRVQVDEALELLNQPDRLFTFEGGDCSAGAVDIDSGMQAEAHGAEHDEHTSDDHGDDQHGAESHSAALITYTYACGDPASLSAIDVEIFGLWEGFNDLDVQLIGPSGQAAVELGPDQPRLDVSHVR